MAYSEAFLEAFRAKALGRQGVPGQCWEWSPATRVTNRYATFSIDYGRERDRVHRLACQAFVEPLTAQKPNALHSCDNKWCWNPDHLRAGTLSDNQQDAWSRARRRRAGCVIRGGSRSCSAGCTCGRHRKRTFSEEHRRKLSESARRYWGRTGSKAEVKAYSYVG